nr:zinc finger, CCHC-type, retrotransposon Gag domain protein [Tanacetum cinerariifolium]
MVRWRRRGDGGKKDCFEVKEDLKVLEDPWEVKETNRKLEYGDRDAKKPKHYHGQKGGGNQTKTPCKKCHKYHLEEYQANLPGCYKCGALNHMSKDCKKPMILCYSCNQVGHKSNECPNPKAIESKPLKAIKEEKARKYLSHGCYAFMAHVIDTNLEKKSLNDVPVVNEFLDVFPEDFSGIPAVRQVKFQMDLISGVTPIAKTSYCLAPSEMKELMSQLDVF